MPNDTETKVGRPPEEVTDEQLETIATLFAEEKTPFDVCMKLKIPESTLRNRLLIQRGKRWVQKKRWELVDIETPEEES
jgi:hypothetical protein